jgi:SAM-dependent methyltransferase
MNDIKPGDIKQSLEAIKKLCTGDFDYETVLDVGSGEGLHADAFLYYEKKVTAVDFGTSKYYLKRKNHMNVEFMIGDFNKIDFGDKRYDCVWCSHILEHQKNVGQFLEKVISLTSDRGYICITVPPLKRNIVGGHVTLWNAGLLLYNLVSAGLDCSEAMVKTYGYNISVIVKKKLFKMPDNLDCDVGDIEKLSNYFPKGCKKQNFNGDIQSLNWE